MRKNKTIFVPDWGIELKVSKEVTLDTKYVGIRAHLFNQEEQQNRQQITVIDVIEQPFENQIRFMFKNQNKEANSICWFVNKEIKDIQKVKEIGINPNDILLLK